MLRAHSAKWLRTHRRATSRWIHRRAWLPHYHLLPWSTYTHKTSLSRTLISLHHSRPHFLSHTSRANKSALHRWSHALKLRHRLWRPKSSCRGSICTSGCPTKTLRCLRPLNSVWVKRKILLKLGKVITGVDTCRGIVTTQK